MAIDRVVLRPTAPAPDDLRATILQAHRRGFRRFAVAPGVELPPDAERIGAFEDRFEPTRAPAVPRRSVGSPEDLATALAVGRAAGAVAIDWTGDRVIPLESAVADRRDRWQLWVVANRPTEAPGFLGALEHGADVVVVEVASPAAVDELESLLDRRERARIEWTVGTVLRIRPVGLADRVLLDTTSLLRPSEGFAVGSRAATLFLVVGEAEGSRFTRPRPFRVNAGPAHSYVLMADGTTRYLSEVEPGEELLAVDADGRTRGVRLGRRKVERRPTILVEVETDTGPSTIFLQEAETVRLGTPDGPIAVTELAVGGRVLVSHHVPGRHLGTPVDETIEER